MQIQHNLPFSLDYENVQPLITNQTYDIDKSYNDYTEPVQTFFQEQYPNFNNYIVYFKKKKGTTILLFTSDQILDIFQWNQYVEINDKKKSISIKAVLSYPNGEIVLISNHTTRQLIDQYFVKLNSQFKQGNFSCHPQSGEIQLKMNSYISKKQFEVILDPKENYSNLHHYFRQSFFSSHQILKEYSLKIATLTNKISEHQQDFLQNQSNLGKRKNNSKLLNKETIRRLEMVKQNLMKCNKQRHPKDPLYDTSQGEVITEQQEKEYFKPIKQPLNQGYSQDIYSELVIQEDGVKLEDVALAGGGFAEIFRATLNVILENKQDSKNIFAIKRERNQEGRSNHEKKILEVLKDKNWPYIAKFFWTSHPELKDSLIMEFYPNKSLEHFILNFQVTISLPSKLFLLWQIAQGIRFLKDNGITHLDLKPANILIGKSLAAKITDFGESYHKDVCDLQFKPGRTIPYVPPEILKRSKDFDYQNDRIDIFSFGVIMSDVLFDEYPMAIKRGQLEKIQLKYKQKKIDKKFVKDLCFMSELLDENDYSKDKEVTYYYRLLDQCKAQQGPKHCMKLLITIIQKCLEDQKDRSYIEYIVVMLKDLQIYLEKITS